MSDTTKIEPNYNAGGIPVFIPFFEKLLLYQEFFRPGNLWVRKKQNYWKHEKAILRWAYSNKHMHLGNPLPVARFLEAYGIDSKENFDINKVEISGNDMNDLVKAIAGDDKRRGFLDQVMANLVGKGLASSVVSYNQIDKRLNFNVAAIIINRSGMLVGQLSEEEQKPFGLIKYAIAKIALYISASIVALRILYEALPVKSLKDTALKLWSNMPSTSIENDKASSIISLSVSLIILFASFSQWWMITYNGEMVTKKWVKILFILSIISLMLSLILLLR